jgi:glucosamine 6-phosphate synthetase-like amidotransferase/phosphosugar isomerase protein
MTKQAMLSTTLWGKSNNHGTGIAWENDSKKIEVVKEPIEASHFWIKNNLDISTESSIFHVRYATTGENLTKNTHPFYDKVSNISVVHNGVISNYDKAKTELIEKGFTFQGECDSEVFLWSYIYKGKDFIEWLKEKGVTGSATILIQDNENIFAFTNTGSLEIFKTETGIVGFSDDCLGYHERNKAFDIEKNCLYRISKEKKVYLVKEKIDLAVISYDSYLYKWESKDIKETIQTKLTSKKVSKEDRAKILAYCKRKYPNSWKEQYRKEVKEYKELMSIDTGCYKMSADDIYGYFSDEEKDDYDDEETEEYNQGYLAEYI